MYIRNHAPHKIVIQYKDNGNKSQVVVMKAGDTINLPQVTSPSTILHGLGTKYANNGLLTFNTILSALT